LPTSSAPRRLPIRRAPASSPAYFSTVAAPSAIWRPSSSNSAYSIAGPTASARFEGSVQGVVVQTQSSGPPRSAKRTVIAGSWRSRYELSSRVSKFDTGVCAAHEYGITR